MAGSSLRRLMAEYKREKIKASPLKTTWPFAPFQNSLWIHLKESSPGRLQRTTSSSGRPWSRKESFNQLLSHINNFPQSSFQWARGHLLRRWRVSSQTHLPARLSAQSAQDEVHLWHVSSKQWVSFNRSRRSCELAYQIDKSLRIFSICRRTGLHFDSARSRWWSHGLRTVRGAMESRAERREDPAERRLDAGRAERRERGKCGRGDYVAREPRGVQPDCK